MGAAWQERRHGFFGIVHIPKPQFRLGRGEQTPRDSQDDREKIAGGEASSSGPIQVTEMDLNDPVQIQTYVNFLHDPRNRPHFANPPRTIAELRQLSRSRSNHVLVGVGVEKDAEGLEQKRVVGGMIIEDAKPNQHDHFISLFVVDPERQGKGIGTELLREGIDWAATHLAGDGRVRDKLDIAYIKGVPGWRRMQKMVVRFGFRRVGELKDQVTVPKITKPLSTERWEVDLKLWRDIKRLPRPQPPHSQPSAK